jgi:hypothetical protein
MIASITIEEGHGGPNNLFMAKMTNRPGIWGPGATRKIAVKEMLRIAASFGEFVANVPIEIIDDTLQWTVTTIGKDLLKEYQDRKFNTYHAS